MASVQVSTGLKNGLLGGKSLKELMNDGVIYLYNGALPASADDPATGTVLCKLTKDGAALTGGALSTAQKDTVTVTAGSQGDQFTVTLNGVAYTYTQGAAETAAIIVAGLAALINAGASAVRAMASTTTTEKMVLIESKFPGESYTIAVSKTGGGTITTANVTANARVNSLHLGSPSAGAIEKANEVWEGVGLVEGVTTYFRHVLNTDTNATSTTEPRIQGVVGTAGTALTMTSTSVAVNAKQTATGYRVRMA